MSSAEGQTTAMDRDEGQRLIELERQVGKAMRSAGRIAGAALTEIRDRKLYRASHTTFEAYCDERWGLSRSAAYRMIEQAKPKEVEGLSQGETSPQVTPAPTSTSAPGPKPDPPRRKTADQEPTILEPSTGPGKTIEPPPKKKAGGGTRKPAEPKAETLPSTSEKVAQLVGADRPPTARQLMYRTLTAMANIDPENGAEVSSPQEATFVKHWTDRYFKSFQQTNGVEPAERPHEPSCSCLRCRADKPKARTR